MKLTIAYRMLSTHVVILVYVHVVKATDLAQSKIRSASLYVHNVVMAITLRHVERVVLYFIALVHVKRLIGRVISLNASGGRAKKEYKTVITIIYYCDYKCCLYILIFNIVGYYV